MNEEILTILNEEYYHPTKKQEELNSTVYEQLKSGPFQILLKQNRDWRYSNQKYNGKSICTIYLLYIDSSCSEAMFSDTSLWMNEYFQRKRIITDPCSVKGNELVKEHLSVVDERLSNPSETTCVGECRTSKFSTNPASPLAIILHSTSRNQCPESTLAYCLSEVQLYFNCSYLMETSIRSGLAILLFRLLLDANQDQIKILLLKLLLQIAKFDSQKFIDGYKIAAQGMPMLPGNFIHSMAKRHKNNKEILELVNQLSAFFCTTSSSDKEFLNKKPKPKPKQTSLKLDMLSCSLRSDKNDRFGENLRILQRTNTSPTKTRCRLSSLNVDIKSSPYAPVRVNTAPGNHPGMMRSNTEIIVSSNSNIVSRSSTNLSAIHSMPSKVEAELKRESKLNDVISKTTPRKMQQLQPLNENQLNQKNIKSLVEVESLNDRSFLATEDKTLLSSNAFDVSPLGEIELVQKPLKGNSCSSSLGNEFKNETSCNNSTLKIKNSQKQYGWNVNSITTPAGFQWWWRTLPVDNIGLKLINMIKAVAKAGRKLHVRDELEGALELYRFALKLENSSAENRASSRKNCEQFERKKIDLYFKIKMNMVCAYDSLKMLSEALSECHSAIALKPEKPYGHYKLGMIFYKLNDFLNARKEFVAVASIFPMAKSALYAVEMRLKGIEAGEIFECSSDELKKFMLENENIETHNPEQQMISDQLYKIFQSIAYSCDRINAELSDLFIIVDKHKNGLIQWSNFEQLLAVCGLNLNKQDSAVLKAYFMLDIDSNEVISYDNLLAEKKKILPTRAKIVLPLSKKENLEFKVKSSIVVPLHQIAQNEVKSHLIFLGNWAKNIVRLSKCHENKLPCDGIISKGLLNFICSHSYFTTQKLHAISKRICAKSMYFGFHQALTKELFRRKIIAETSLNLNNLILKKSSQLVADMRYSMRCEVSFRFLKHIYDCVYVKKELEMSVLKIKNLLAVQYRLKQKNTIFLVRIKKLLQEQNQIANDDFPKVIIEANSINSFRSTSLARLRVVTEKSKQLIRDQLDSHAFFKRSCLQAQRWCLRNESEMAALNVDVKKALKLIKRKIADQNFLIAYQRKALICVQFTMQVINNGISLYARKSLVIQQVKSVAKSFAYECYDANERLYSFISLLQDDDDYENEEFDDVYD